MQQTLLDLAVKATADTAKEAIDKCEMILVVQEFYRIDVVEFNKTTFSIAIIRGNKITQVNIGDVQQSRE